MIGVAELFRWVVDVGAAGALLLGVAYGVMLVVRQPARRVRVAEVALIGCLLLLVVQAVPASRISLGIVETGRPMQLPWFDAEGSLSYSSGFSRDAAPIAIVQPLQKTAATFSQLSLYWREALLTLYALGVILAGGRLALACWSLRRLRQRGRQATGELAALWSELTRGRGSAVLLISDEASRPMTFGRVVLLPQYVADAPRHDIAAILKHELSHIECRDARSWALAAAVNVAMFFIPTLWLVKREMRLAQEFLADRAAVDVWGGEAIGYAEMLLRLVTKRQTMAGGELAMGAWTRRSELLRRVKHLFAVREVLDRQATRRWTAAVAVAVLLTTACLGAVTLADTSLKSQVRGAELRGVGFLLAKQDANGGWLTEMGPAPTALVVRSLLQAGVPREHGAVVRALAFVDGCRRADGGYYTDGEPTYQTAVVMSMYAALGDEARVEEGRGFLRRELERPTKGAGAWYQDSSRAFADPQERAADAVLETYGSLTYARWKSLVYAGLAETDPRVVQAAKWVEANWTLEKHPGTGSVDGLYYYYLAAARTLKAAGVEGAGGGDWRGELGRKLVREQAGDGSWVNRLSGRWLEDRAEMVTAYALLALQETR